MGIFAWWLFMPVSGPLLTWVSCWALFHFYSVYKCYLDFIFVTKLCFGNFFLSFFKRSIYFYFMCMCVCLHVSVYHMLAGVVPSLGSWKRALDPWNWSHRRLCCMVWVLGTELGPLYKQQVLLTTEPSLQLSFPNFWLKYTYLTVTWVLIVLKNKNPESDVRRKCWEIIETKEQNHSHLTYSTSQLKKILSSCLLLP